MDVRYGKEEKRRGRFTRLSALFGRRRYSARPSPVKKKEKAASRVEKRRAKW